jgi:hypothetical protein
VKFCHLVTLKKKKGGREENLNLTRISFDKKWHIKSPYFEGKKKTFARFWPQLQGPLPEFLVGFKTILLCSLAGSQTWLSPLLEACQSTYLTNLRKKEKKAPGPVQH